MQEEKKIEIIKKSFRTVLFLGRTVLIFYYERKIDKTSINF